MSVAALSTASPILATAAASANPGGATAVNDAEPFAKLISRPAEDDRAPKGDAKPAPEADSDADMTVDARSEDGARAETDAKDDSAEQQIDLLAGIEAMVAAASRLVVAPPSPAAVATIAASAKSGSTAAAPTAIDAGSAIRTPALPIAATKSPMQIGETLTPATPATSDEPPFPAIIADMPAKTGIAAADGGAKPTLKGDIASLLAALKSSAATPMTGAQAMGTPAPSDSPTTTVVDKDASPSSGDGQPASSGFAAIIDGKPASASIPLVKTMTGEKPTVAAETPARAEAMAAQAVPDILTTKAGEKRAAQTDPKFAANNEQHDGVVIPTIAASAKADQPVAATIVDAKPAHAPVTIAAAAPSNGAERKSDAERDARVDAAAAAKDIRDTSAANDAREIDATQVIAAPLPLSSSISVGDGTVVDSASATLASQSVDRQLDLSRETQWLDKLAQDINQAATMQSNLKFQLNPEHLGSLHIEISNGADGASIRMTTDNDQARAIIADAQPRLIAEVRAQGLRVADTNVDLNQQQQSGGGNGQTMGGQMQGEQQRRSSEDHKPFSITPANQRDVASDSDTRNDGELYA